MNPPIAYSCIFLSFLSITLELCRIDDEECPSSTAEGQAQHIHASVSHHIESLLALELEYIQY